MMGMLIWIDLGKEQVLITDGDPIRLSQLDVGISGLSIGCRVNAESPEEVFRPSAGRITLWVPPKDVGIRVDNHCYLGYLISHHCESLIAKVITTGSERREAIERIEYALSKFSVSRVPTTIAFH